MNFRTALAGMAVAGAVALAGPATSAQADGCGGEWTAEQSCSFVYDGGSIGVGLGLGTDPLGVGVVRLEADLPVRVTRVKTSSRKAKRRTVRKRSVRKVLLTCEAFGMYGVCAAGSSSSDDIVPLGTQLTCTVTGRIAAPGRFQCHSGTDEPTATSGEVHNGGGL